MNEDVFPIAHEGLEHDLQVGLYCQKRPYFSTSLNVTEGFWRVSSSTHALLAAQHVPPKTGVAMENSLTGNTPVGFRRMLVRQDRK